MWRYKVAYHPNSRNWLAHLLSRVTFRLYIKQSALLFEELFVVDHQRADTIFSVILLQKVRPALQWATIQSLSCIGKIFVQIFVNRKNISDDVNILVPTLSNVLRKPATQLKIPSGFFAASPRLLRNKTDSCKTDTSIRRTPPSVPMSNFHCKLPLEMDTCNRKDDF